MVLEASSNTTRDCLGPKRDGFNSGPCYQVLSKWKFPVICKCSTVYCTHTQMTQVKVLDYYYPSFRCDSPIKIIHILTFNDCHDRILMVYLFKWQLSPPGHFVLLVAKIFYIFFCEIRKSKQILDIGVKLKENCIIFNFDFSLFLVTTF